MQRKMQGKVNNTRTRMKSIEKMNVSKGSMFRGKVPAEKRIEMKTRTKCKREASDEKFQQNK